MSIEMQSRVCEDSLGFRDQLSMSVSIITLYSTLPQKPLICWIR